MTDKTAISVSIAAQLTAVLTACFGTAAVLFATVPWAQMWCIAAALFFAAKTAVLRHAKSRRRIPANASPYAFALLWPGMNWAQWTSAAVGGTATRGTLLDGGLNVGFGLVLMFGMARLIPQPLAATWVAMIGLIFTFHCGAFTLLAAVWQALGRGVRPIMHCPIAAASITEFWGKRWNLAFRDLAHTTIFMPAARRLGAGGATWVVFIVSGIAHDLVISVAAHGGYGWPTVYFIVQGVGHAIEQRCQITSALVWRLRAWVFVALPLPLLFHAPFVLRVMRPFFINLHALA